MSLMGSVFPTSLMGSVFPTTSTIGYMLYCAARVYLYHLILCVKVMNIILLELLGISLVSGKTVATLNQLRMHYPISISCSARSCCAVL